MGKWGWGLNSGSFTNDILKNKNRSLIKMVTQLYRY